MPPAPLFIALTLGGASLSGLVTLALDPDPFAAGSAAALGAGGSIITIVSLVGVVLARGRWSRFAVLGTAAVWFGVAVAGPLGIGSATTAVLAVAAASAAAGPWLERWVRHLPSAEGAPPAAVVLLLSLIATPVAVGALSPTTNPTAAAWGFIGWSLGLAFLLSRAVGWSLWLCRILHVPAAVLAGFTMPLVIGGAIALKAASESLLTWRRDVSLAVRPLLVEASPGVPIPPELVDPAIMEAAGLDDRGHPIELR